MAIIFFTACTLGLLVADLIIGTPFPRLVARAATCIATLAIIGV